MSIENGESGASVRGELNGMTLPFGRVQHKGQIT